jgi:hypothetical protein
MHYIHIIRCLTVFLEVSDKSHELTWCHFILLICAFFSAGYDEPYLLALLTDCIEIRTVEPCLFIQSMTVPKPRLVVRCRQGLVYVASVDHVWRLQAVPLARQIHVLLEDKQFQLALKLTVCIIILIRLCMKCQIIFFYYTGWPQFIHHISGTHRNWSIQSTENWCALLERTTHQVQYFATWTPFVAHIMSKRYSILCHVFSTIWCVRRSCIVDSCTKFNHIANFWTEYLVLYIAPKGKKFYRVISVEWGIQGVGLSHPIHLDKFYPETHCKAAV